MKVFSPNDSEAPTHGLKPAAPFMWFMISLHHIELNGYKIRWFYTDELLCVFLFQEKFTTRHELALLRVSTLMGLVMFGGMSSLFYTQMTGVLSVSTEQWRED